MTEQGGDRDEAAIDDGPSNGLDIIDASLSSLAIQSGKEQEGESQHDDESRQAIAKTDNVASRQPTVPITSGEEPGPTEGNATFGGFKIMRREGGGRSDSPRNRLGLVDGSGSGVRDRRNMTIEEREAAYREARQRIFGSEEGIVETSADVSAHLLAEGEGRGVVSEGESGTSSKEESRKGTPGRVSPAPSSTSSSSSTAFLRAGAPSFDPNIRGGPSAESQWQQPFMYPLVDANGQQYYPYPGGYVWPVLQHDINGRQIISNGSGPLISPTYPFPTPGSSGSNQELFSSVGPSPSVSSRSTSISAETEGEGGRSGIIEQAKGGTSTPASRAAGQISRAQSVSPTVPMHNSNGHQAVGGSSSSGGSSAGGGSMAAHVYQGQIPVPPSWNYYQQSATVPYNNSGGGVPSSNHMNGRPSPIQPYNAMQAEDGSARARMGYAAAAQGMPSKSGLMHSSSGSSSHSSGSGGPGYYSPGNPGPYRGEENSGAHAAASRGRGRSSHPDRFLFDPNKPSGGSVMRSDAGSMRHAIGKSASAAGMLESRPSEDQSGSSSNAGNGILATSSQDINRRVSSGNQSSDSVRKSTPPSHPSLPARPDWVMLKNSKLDPELRIEEANDQSGMP